MIMLVNKQFKKIRPSRYITVWTLTNNGKPRLKIKELSYT